MPVRFSEEEEIFIIPNNEQEDRSIGMMYYRDLINNCENCERELVKMINDNCANKIILIVEGYPLTVRDTEIPWYQDDTVCKIHQHMVLNENFARNFYRLFDDEVNNTIELYSFSHFFLNIDNVKFYFNKVIRLPKL